MSQYFIDFFGEVSKNEIHERSLILDSGEEIIVSLFTDALSKDGLLSKIDIATKSLNTIINSSKNAIINSCQIDGVYEEKMKTSIESVKNDFASEASSPRTS